MYIYDCDFNDHKNLQIQRLSEIYYQVPLIFSFLVKTYYFYLSTFNMGMKQERKEILKKCMSLLNNSCNQSSGFGFYKDK